MTQFNHFSPQLSYTSPKPILLKNLRGIGLELKMRSKHLKAKKRETRHRTRAIPCKNQSSALGQIHDCYELSQLRWQFQHGSFHKLSTVAISTLISGLQTKNREAGWGPGPSTAVLRGRAGSRAGKAHMPTSGGRSNKPVFLCVFVRCIIQDPNLIQTIWTVSRPVLAQWSRSRVPRAAPSSCGARHGLAPRLQALHLHGGTIQSLCKSKGPCFFQSALEAAEVCLGESKAGNGFQPVCRFQGCRICPGLW